MIEPARRVDKELPLLDGDLSGSLKNDDDGAEKSHPGPTHAFSFSYTPLMWDVIAS